VAGGKRSATGWESCPLPKDLDVRLRALLLSLFIAVALTGTTGLAAAPAADAGTSAEARLFQKINNARARHGLAPVRLSTSLSDYARSHSRSMSRQRTLFHTSDFTVICCWSSISENVGMAGSVRGVHRAFMRSPAHRANILDRGKRAVGVGIVHSGGKFWVTEVFRRPS
jgi:uncharacterized protein YkwD